MRPGFLRFGPVLVLLAGAFVCPGGAGAAEASAVPAIRSDGALELVRSDGTIAATIVIEIAETPEARAAGLMGRRLPDFSGGMLFICDREEVQEFWMHDTPAPLDLIFLREDRRVLGLIDRAAPMSDRTLRSPGPARYVLEVKGGFAQRFGIDSSVRVRWRRAGETGKNGAGW